MAIKNQYIAVENIQDTLIQRLIPVITLWNRLEARPRTDNFDRALKAEVRDALWMMTKQWQMGEFRGDDAGSPVFAKIQVDTTRITKYQADSHGIQAYDESVPLEAKVEQRHIPFTSGDQIISLDIRLQMGRQWLKMTAGIGSLKSTFIADFPIEAPDPKAKEHARICAHRETWAQFEAVAGKAMDGYKLYQYIKINGPDAINVPAANKPDIIAKAEKFVQWFEKLYLQPEDEENNAWLPSQLEYQFSCAAPKSLEEKVMVAEAYYHGHLDWFNLDIDPQNNNLGEVPDVPKDVQSKIIESFMPTPLSFDGMPNTRWWSFEDSRTNFGNINPDTTDLNKLLLMEFGLIYANDWFLFPLTMPTGSIANVRGISVTNTFGERYWIEAAGKGEDDDWQRWSMYTISTKGVDNATADNSVLILPSTDKMLEGKALEEIRMIRDEVANMAWAIEKRITLPHGWSKPGAEAALELTNQYQKVFDQGVEEGSLAEDIPPEYKANIRYEVMNSVPENWIPFIPVHKSTSASNNREIQLQRASLPRILKNQSPGDFEKIKPHTSLLRKGLDQEVPEPYFVYEEEVPRAGVVITQSFQRSRWYQGKVVNWLGVRKMTGRGEGSSGLAYDRIVPVPQKGDSE